MQYFKKFPLFFVLMAVLLAAFVAGVVYDAVCYGKVATAQKRLNNAKADYEDAWAVDPTQKAIDAASANIKALENHLAALEKSLTRARGDIFTAAPSESYQLVESLRGVVQDLKRTASKSDIAVKKGMDFGFKRYVEPNAEPPLNAAVAPVWKQACVLKYISGKLFASKTEQSPMAILNVQREILPAELSAKKAAPQRRMTARERRAAARLSAMKGADSSSETFTIDPNITARKAGSLDTLAYRFTFAGHTDILRRFLNQLKDFDAMLVVRSIDVVPADESVNEVLNASPEDDETAGLDAIFGTNNNNSDSSSSEAAPAENSQADQAKQEELEKIKTPVVTGNLSKFSVVIEYVEVVKDDPNAAKKVKKEEE